MKRCFDKEVTLRRQATEGQGCERALPARPIFIAPDSYYLKCYPCWQHAEAFCTLEIYAFRVHIIYIDKREGPQEGYFLHIDLIRLWDEGMTDRKE